jgi:hypothetical protein
LPVPALRLAARAESQAACRVALQRAMFPELDVIEPGAQVSWPVVDGMVLAAGALVSAVGVLALPWSVLVAPREPLGPRLAVEARRRRWAFARTAGAGTQ